MTYRIKEGASAHGFRLHVAATCSCRWFGTAMTEYRFLVGHLSQSCHSSARPTAVLWRILWTILCGTAGCIGLSKS